MLTPFLTKHNNHSKFLIWITAVSIDPISGVRHFWSSFANWNDRFVASALSPVANKKLCVFAICLFPIFPESDGRDEDQNIHIQVKICGRQLQNSVSSLKQELLCWISSCICVFVRLCNLRPSFAELDGSDRVGVSAVSPVANKKR